MQVNPLVNKGNDLLGSLTVPVNGWVVYSVADMSKYNYISITVMTSDDGSYSEFIAMDDFVNINSTNALVIYGTSNTNRIMASYATHTSMGLYNTHGNCTVIVRGYM